MQQPSPFAINRTMYSYNTRHLTYVGLGEVPCACRTSFKDLPVVYEYSWSIIQLLSRPSSQHTPPSTQFPAITRRLRHNCWPGKNATKEPSTSNESEGAMDQYEAEMFQAALASERTHTDGSKQKSVFRAVGTLLS